MRFASASGSRNVIRSRHVPPSTSTAETTAERSARPRRSRRDEQPVDQQAERALELRAGGRLRQLERLLELLERGARAQRRVAARGRGSCARRPSAPKRSATAARGRAASSPSVRDAEALQRLGQRAARSLRRRARAAGTGSGARYAALAAAPRPPPTRRARAARGGGQRGEAGAAPRRRGRASRPRGGRRRPRRRGPRAGGAARGRRRRRCPAAPARRPRRSPSSATEQAVVRVGDAGGVGRDELQHRAARERLPQPHPRAHAVGLGARPRRRRPRAPAPAPAPAPTGRAAAPPVRRRRRPARSGGAGGRRSSNTCSHASVRPGNVRLRTSCPVIRIVAAAAALALLAVPERRRVDLQRRGRAPARPERLRLAAGVAAGTGSPHLYDQVAAVHRASSYKPHDVQPARRDGDAARRRRRSCATPTACRRSRAAARERRVVGRRLRGRPGPAVPARAVPPRDHRAAGGDPRQGLPRRRPHRAARLLHARPSWTKMFAALPPRCRRARRAYRDGVNAWIATCARTRTTCPASSPRSSVPLDRLDEATRSAIGDLPRAHGAERRRQRARRTCARCARSGRTRSTRCCRSATTREPLPTVPRAEGALPVAARPHAQAGARGAQAHAGRERRTGTLPSAKAAGAGARERRRGAARAASAARTCSRSREPETRHAFLFNGPQLGFSIPELFVEFELHYAGLDLRGVTAAGVPVIGIGHNDQVAWGFTSRAVGRGRPVRRGARRATRRPSATASRARTARWSAATRPSPTASPPTDVAGSRRRRPTAGAKTERICRTVHGPVQVRAGRTGVRAPLRDLGARARDARRASTKLNRAKTIGDVDAAMRKVTWNENVMAVDTRGQHRLLASRACTSCARSAATSASPTRAPARPSGAGLRDRRDDAARHQPEAGLAGQLEQRAVEGLDDRRRRGAPSGWPGAFHRAPVPAAARSRAVRAQADVRAARRALISRRRHDRAAAAAGRGAAARARRRARPAARRRCSTRCCAWDGSYHRVDDDGTVDPGVAMWEEFKDQARDDRARPARAGPRGDGRARRRSRARRTSSTSPTARRTRCARSSRRAWLPHGGARRRAAELDEAVRHARTSPKWREPRRMYEWHAPGRGVAAGRCRSSTAAPGSSSSRSARG